MSLQRSEQNGRHFDADDHSTGELQVGQATVREAVMRGEIAARAPGRGRSSVMWFAEVFVGPRSQLYGSFAIV